MRHAQVVVYGILKMVQSGLKQIKLTGFSIASIIIQGLFWQGLQTKEFGIPLITGKLGFRQRRLMEHFILSYIGQEIISLAHHKGFGTHQI